METWDILDRQGKPTGRTVVRGLRNLSRDEYHLVVHVWIVNDEGKLLIQKRADIRPLMPGEWAATGGSAVSGEDSRYAAYRELKEELGFKVNPRDFILERRMIRKNSITDIWSAKVNISVDKLKLQKEEVSQAKWVTAQQLRQMIKNGEFHNYGDDYFSTVFDIAAVERRNK